MKGARPFPGAFSGVLRRREASPRTVKMKKCKKIKNPANPVANAEDFLYNDSSNAEDPPQTKRGAAEFGLLCFRNEIAGFPAKRCAVLGVGVSNLPLIRLLCAAGATVEARDKRSPENLAQTAQSCARLPSPFARATVILRISARTSSFAPPVSARICRRSPTPSRTAPRSYLKWSCFSSFVPVRSWGSPAATGKPPPPPLFRFS